MTYYFCLVSAKDADTPSNFGRSYVYKNKSKWIKAPDVVQTYLTAGYVKGIDHAVYKGKAYQLWKSFIDLETGDVIFLVRESVAGCDI